ncbi:unnamed protein product [Linum trigynum]|uniref:Hexosyltransferase n=1 Tax=Linum trigynum TaxID=586398 RepID=A0AAV2FQV6_9ROSI
MAAILSTLQHSSSPENIHFHFIFTLPSLHKTILRSVPYLRCQLHIFAPSPIQGLIFTSIGHALDSSLNYARNHLLTLLPNCLTNVLYLDSDLILVDD